MPKIFGAITLLLMLAMVIARVLLLKKRGIRAMKFGETDRSDFLIPPFALFLFYIICAHAFDLPSLTHQHFFESDWVAWAGVVFCLAGLGLLLWGILSFGRSFRVGIDARQPGELITTGAFAFSRNPIYVAFAIILIGQFLIFPNFILLIALAAAAWLFHRQVLREEAYLKEHYGDAYAAYCRKVRRYL